MINFLLYQSAWFALILGVSYDLVWPGIGFALVTLVVHFFVSTVKRKDLVVLLLTTLLGTIAETVFQLLNVFEIVRGDLWPPIAAPWLIVMWASFSTTLCRSMEWVFKSGKTALALGFVFGPIAYVGGNRMGAIRLELTWERGFMLAIIWALVMLVLSVVVQKVDPLGHFEGNDS